jgi:hypothetical protein
MATGSRTDSVEAYWEVIRPHLIVEKSINSMVLLKILMRIRQRVLVPTFAADLKIREYISTVFNTFGVEVSFQTIREHFQGVLTDYDFEKPHENKEVLKRLDEISRMWPDVTQ